MLDNEKTPDAQIRSTLPPDRGINDLMTMEEVLTYFGGSKPIHPATLYRGMKNGTYPRPIKPSANIARWVRSECEHARKRMMEERDV